MKVQELKEKQPHLYNILKEMFDIVGASYDIDISKGDWFYKNEWNRQQELSFINWLTDYLKSTKVMKEIAGHKMVNLSMRKKVADLFVMNYGWKTK